MKYVFLLLIPLLFLGCVRDAEPSVPVITQIEPVVPTLDPPYSVNPVDSGLAPEAIYHNTAEKIRGIQPTDVSITGWSQAIIIESAWGATPAPKIEMDYLQLSIYRNGKWICLARDDYDDGSFTAENGMLYSRENWEYNPLNEAMPATETNSILTCKPASLDSVYHWWTKRSTDIQIGDSFRIEARLRITGGALCQIGVDLKNATEKEYIVPALVTDWFGPTNNHWITITNEYTVNLPNHATKPVVFNLAINGSNLSSASITGDWTAWNSWVPQNMKKISDNTFEFDNCYRSGTPAYFNFSYIENGLTKWATNSAGKTSVVDVWARTDGKSIPVSMKANGLSGSASGYNFYFLTPE